MRYSLSAVVAGLLAIVVQAEDKPAHRAADYFSTYPAAKLVPLDAKIRAALDADNSPAISDMAPAEARVWFEKRVASVPRLDDPIAKVEKRTISGPGGKLPLRVYTPQGQGPFPILLFFHGGGWVVGSLDTVDDPCRTLCSRAAALVVSVDYRLAPEHKFPAAQEDCYAALKWCSQHAGEINGDGKRLAVAGDSAGGNLAAATALSARDKKGPPVALQVLIYPCLLYTSPSPRDRG
jgi:acetyl esterase